MKTELDRYIATFSKQLGSLTSDKIFYFDESNNIKKGIIGYDKDNVNDLEHLFFVLGGIAVDKDVDFDELLKYIGARQVPCDAKFKFFSFKKTKFEEAIKQERLKKLFEYLLQNNICIHFDVLHYMHFALTDILDSLIEEDDINQKIVFLYYKQLQSDLTEVLYSDYGALHFLLCKYSFPNVHKDKCNDFIKDLYDLYLSNLSIYDMNNYENFTKELLRQIIKAKREKTNLVFLSNNEPFIISNNMSFTYLTRMIEIKSKKIFDDELSVAGYICGLDRDYNHKLLVTFENSKCKRELQLSDAICGFVARLYNFISHRSDEEIVSYVLSLDKNSTEYNTLILFDKLMTVSSKLSPVMFKKTNPLFIEKKFTLFFSLLSSF